MSATTKAHELRAKLFSLVGEFKDFHLQLLNVETAAFQSEDAASDARGDADAAACDLAAVHQRISELDLFQDFARDTPTYGVELGGE